jgi:hypothetical protein
MKENIETFTINRPLGDVCSLKISAFQVVCCPLRKPVRKSGFSINWIFWRSIFSQEPGPFEAGFSQIESTMPRLLLLTQKKSAWDL